MKTKAKLLTLPTCRVFFHEPNFPGAVAREDRVTTVFMGGLKIGAFPHEHDPHYHVAAHRHGYNANDGIVTYCQEHEFFHAFVWWALYREKSPVLWTLAQEKRINPSAAVIEEAVVSVFTRWVRANEEPIISGVDWWTLKQNALLMLDHPTLTDELI